jgi:iron complex transport system permease protein
MTAAVIVSFVGIINFIGLIAPHLVRRFIGGDYRFLLPASAIAGALLLLLSDTLARLAVSPVILPIGAITSFLGAPMFLYLLFRGVRK